MTKKFISSDPTVVQSPIATKPYEHLHEPYTAKKYS